MSDGDGHRCGGREGGMVEPVQKSGGDIGGENMDTFLVREICPNNVSLEDGRY